RFAGAFAIPSRSGEPAKQTPVAVVQAARLRILSPTALCRRAACTTDHQAASASGSVNLFAIRSRIAYDPDKPSVASPVTPDVMAHERDSHQERLLGRLRRPF